MILNEINDNALAIPCKICGQIIDQTSQIFRIPPFDPYFLTKEQETVKEMISYIGAQTHRSCWSNWSNRELICSSVTQGLKHEFRRAMCIAESHQVIACATKNENPEFTPGVLFLPRSSLISRHILGINLGEPVVRERGKCVEHIVNILTKREVVVGFSYKVLMRTKYGKDYSVGIQFDEEFEDVIKINFICAKNDVYAVYFLYKPDIE
ncbi:MAG: hypothetical protein SAJ12_24260, partial [Jaaginema sp. PMC 1079.18]|nr:hypothetical protein [Jaaginema sp. PMC 1079.18]